MRTAYLPDEWRIVEEGFHPESNRESESIFSIGNGYMGQRANFEENYSGDTLQGSYIAGIYYPDKTRVGWWKNGYPEYFAKVINSPKWIGIDIKADGESIDLAQTDLLSFTRILDMKEGFLERKFTIRTRNGKTLNITARRFLSMEENDAGIIRYSIKSVDFSGEIEFSVFLDSDVRNEDSNYGEKFWKEITGSVDEESGVLISSTLITDYHVSTGMTWELLKNNKKSKADPKTELRSTFVSHDFSIDLKAGDEATLIKYSCVLSSMHYPPDSLMENTKKRLKEISAKGYDKLFSDHKKAWDSIWKTADIKIDGDTAAQQGIRFNIFQLYQTYTGEDERLNIGPKGFTGEKYGGSTYWDTEAFVFPFFLKTAESRVPRNLLLYRYRHLPQSIKNAEKLGFKNGAALYPMVTMNGEECHNEWEITFEEIHRNGAIAFAIYNYIRHTGDRDYLDDYGLEVLIGISRFWSQRVNWSEPRKKYVMLGVTGPNEYENNVNNNWYTNSLAVWTLSYTLQNLERLKSESAEKYSMLTRRTSFNVDEETPRWKEIISGMHFPYDEERKVFLQQDCFLDKELMPADRIPPDERPINQHWSWDRILRSCFIKQADVLQGLYVFEDNYDTETIKRNFDFYEPMTVHESSLSACIHSILASRIGNLGKAYELYLRTARLDLDDFNNEVADGLHITSMAGTWSSVVEGFGGMRIKNDRIILRPLIPEKWNSYSFHARFRGILFEVNVNRKNVTIKNYSEDDLNLIFHDKDFTVPGKKTLILK
jgi:maltose phosphorylase